MLQVREVSRKIGVNPQTLYFYERIGLVPSPARTDSGYRIYNDQDLERLVFITRAKSLGLSLDEISKILALKSDNSGSCCQLVRDRLHEKVAQIEKTIRQLQTLRAELLPLVEQCDRGLVTTREECGSCWMDGCS
jgi:DNA-binding transcriptional MerR regulator